MYEQIVQDRFHEENRGQPGRYSLSFKFEDVVKTKGIGPAYTYWKDEVAPQVMSLVPDWHYNDAVAAIYFDEYDQKKIDMIRMFFPNMVFGVMDWHEMKWLFLDLTPAPYVI